MNKEEWKSGIYGAASGLLLTMPHIWAIAAPLQLMALFPVLYLASRPTTKYRRMIYAGVYMGIFYVLPQACVLRMPLWITLILFAELIILFSIFALLCYLLFHKPTLAGAIAVGASLVLIDWVNFTAIPIWGVAQSIVRPWSRYPKLISFVSVTGLTGIIFLLGALQALIVSMIAGRKQRKKNVFAAFVLIFTFMAVDLILQSQEPEDKIIVSAIGWKDDSNSVSYPEDSNSLYARLVRKAALESSKLVVSPELGFYNVSGDENKWLLNFRDIAEENNISLVIGAALQQSNKAIFIGPDGRVLGEYTKTHLTPFENYKKGDGKPVTALISGINTGVMICHDDNFTDLSRRYGRQGVSLMAIPTLDWLQVKDAHLQSSINRAIESNYAIVRACCNGISAIISPKGEVLNKMDHLAEGPGIITAQVPVYSGRTLFSLFGHWPVVPSFVFLLAFLAGEIKSKIWSAKRTPDQEK